MVLAAAALNLMVGAAALVGWFGLHPSLVQWNRHLAPISFYEALSLVLIGLGLTGLNHGAFRVALFCALPVALYGTAAATSYVVGAPLDITHTFFTGASVFAHFSGQIAPLSALMLVVASFALAFSALTEARVIGPSAGALLMALGATGLVGQITPFWPIWRDLRTVSLPGSLGMFVLGAATLNHGWKEIRGRRLGLAFLTATIFLTVTVVLAAALRTYEQDELTRTTQAVWRGVADELREQTDRPLAVARMAERWGTLGVPPPERAREEATLLLKETTGLKALVWIAPSSRVLWRVPSAGSRKVVGRFLNANPHRALALERARTRHKVVMTPLIPLFGGGHGFVVVVPVRRAGHFEGYLAGIFHPSSFFSHLPVTIWQGFYVSMDLNHARIFVRGRSADPSYRHVGQVRFLGEPLTITVSPGRHVINKIKVGLPTIVLLSGVLLALFSAAAVYVMQQAQGHAKSLDHMNSGLEGLVFAHTAALQEERERWHVILMSIGDGVIVTDIEGHVLVLNGEAERLTGYADKEARGKPIATVLPLYQSGQGRRVEGPVADALRSGETQYLKSTLLLKTRDGRVLHISDSAAPIRNEDGEVTGTVMVFRDVTERNILEEQAMKARSLEALGVLAGGIAHDFNNILTAIFGNIALAKIYAPADESLQGALSDAERASWRARELTFQLLTFAKGGAPIKKAGFLGDTVRDLSRFFMKGSAVRCEFALPDDLWPTEFDPDQMGQVVQNIVLNAKEAMNGAGLLKIRGRNVVLAHTEVADLPAGDYVEIAFQDTGRGIESEHLNRIFDPYFSLKPAGMGLGLAVTYSVVKRHKGAVIADSILGQGATLTLYLPRSRARVAPVVSVVSAAKGTTVGGAGRRILLMDDDADVRATGAGLLRSLGYVVVVTESGEEAIRLYEKAEGDQRFHAVILDLTVRGALGGKECVRVLRERDPAVRAIVATGYYTDPIIAEFQAYGFVAAIQKPYRIEDLSGVLARVLEI